MEKDVQRPNEPSDSDGRLCATDERDPLGRIYQGLAVLSRSQTQQRRQNVTRGEITRQEVRPAEEWTVNEATRIIDRQPRPPGVFAHSP
jgi:hypothetical protein